MIRETLTIGEAADCLGIGRSLAYRAARDGSIPTIRLGNRLLVPRAKLTQLLEGGHTRRLGSRAGAWGAEAGAGSRGGVDEGR